MEYRNVTCTRRFLAFLVDTLIVMGIANLILFFIPLYKEQNKIFLESYWEYIINSDVDFALLETLFKSMVISTGIHLLVVLPLTFLYYVVLAYFWDKQTIGRLLIGAKIITYRGEEKPSFSRFILRELVGGYLCMNAMGKGVVYYIVTWILSANSGRSLADYIGGTRLVYVDPIPVKSKAEPWTMDKEEDEFIEAEFKDTASRQDKKEEEDYKVF